MLLWFIVYDYKEIQFLEPTVYVENGFLKTKIFLSLQIATNI